MLHNSRYEYTWQLSMAAICGSNTDYGSGANSSSDTVSVTSSLSNAHIPFATYFPKRSAARYFPPHRPAPWARAAGGAGHGWHRPVAVGRAPPLGVRVGDAVGVPGESRPSSTSTSGGGSRIEALHQVRLLRQRIGHRRTVRHEHEGLLEHRRDFACQATAHHRYQSQGAPALNACSRLMSCVLKRGLGFHLALLLKALVARA